MLFLLTAFYLSKAGAKLRRISKLTKKYLIVQQQRRIIRWILHGNFYEHPRGGQALFFGNFLTLT